MSVISKKTAEHYKWGDDCDGWHLVKSKNLSVIQESMPPNSFEKRHFHQSAEQFFFVLSGIASIELDGENFTVPASTGIHVTIDYRVCAIPSIKLNYYVRPER